MGLELISRPVGNKLSTSPIQGFAVDDGGGEVRIYVPGGHSLSDGDYVYIESNLDAYNGYKYVDATAYDYFKIKDSQNGEFIPYYQDTEVTYYISVLQHGWQCVHLPIIYELQSNIWPNNIAEEEYTPTIIVSFENYNGYALLNLSVGMSSPQAYGYIELIAGYDALVNGPYQIVEVLQPWALVIDLAYDAAYDFTGYHVVKYYNNYHVNIEVWAGLEPGHRWESLFHFALRTTLKLIPDSTGKVRFSIHEILKGYIRTRNNLTLNTLPNNTDFHTSFFIKYYEAYDVSDGEDITIEEGDVTEDDFIGHATNSMLPFKSLDAGFMSDYVYPAARWLTLFDRPVVMIDYFFDLSFINQFIGADILIKTGGTLTQTITNPGSGIIRVPLEFEAEGEYCIQAFADGGNGTLELQDFANRDTGGPAWTTGANPSVSITSGATSDLLFRSFIFAPGVEYTINVNFDVSGGGGITGTFRIKVFDSDFNELDSDSEIFAAGGNHNASSTFTAPEGATILAFNSTIVSATRTVDINTVSYVTGEFAITEEICIDVIEECGDTFGDDDLRITDDDLPRIV